MNKYAIIALCLPFSGCVEPARSSVDPDGAIYVTNGQGEAGITEFKLSDGTRCVALIGSYKGAITCDWITSLPENQSGL